MKACDILRHLETEERVYSSNGWYPRYSGPAYEWIKTADPRQNYFQPQELGRLEEDGESFRDQTLVRTLVQWGPSDATVIEKHFGIVFPKWIHAFFAEVTRAAILLRNPIMILSPGEIVEFEKLRRKAFGNELPIRQVGFAHAGIAGGSYAFRMSHSKGIWQIAYSTLDCTLDEEQSVELEQLTECDDDFDTWLTRLWETDGHPLARGSSHEVCFTEREPGPRTGDGL